MYVVILICLATNGLILVGWLKLNDLIEKESGQMCQKSFHEYLDT